MTSIRALIFDFDGLILETEGPVYQSWLELYRSYGFDLPFSTWATLIGTSDLIFDPRKELEARLGRAPRIAQLLDSWGGATIVYRRRLIDSPSYTLNHEEVEKALEEGVVFSECLSPQSIALNGYGAASSMTLSRQVLAEDGKWRSEGEVTLKANTIFVAAGTQPNTVLAREDSTHFALDGKYFRACDEQGQPVPEQRAQGEQPTQGHQAGGLLVDGVGVVLEDVIPLGARCVLQLDRCCHCSVAGRLVDEEDGAADDDHK